MNGTLKFNLLFMVEKRKLGPIKLMVSIQSSTQFLNFMATTGIIIQTSFLMKTLFIQPSKIKTKTPWQSRIFVPEINSVYKTCKSEVTPLKLSGKRLASASHSMSRNQDVFVKTSYLYPLQKVLKPRSNYSMHSRRIFIWLCRMWH